LEALEYESAVNAPPAPRVGSNAALALLTLGTTALAGLLLWRGLTTWLEAVSFVTGAVCVWLTVRESVWNFPIGMVNVATFAFVFLRARLYADAGLQVVYFVLGGIGWYLWLYGGAGRTALPITRTPARRAVGVGLAIALMFAGEYALLRKIGGSAPFWDALTTAISLGAQWLLDRKHLENWLLWIAVDVIYVPLYLSKQLYLTSGLYAVFLCMATLGWLQWHATWRQRERRLREMRELREAVPT
jgi:nicotinamide mononucleotide transporter